MFDQALALWALCNLPEQKSEQKAHSFVLVTLCRLAANDHIPVENFITGETSQRMVIEVSVYRGQFIVYGELATHSVWFPRPSVTQGGVNQ